MNLKIYKLCQRTNHEYDTYDSMIVIAANPKDASWIHPSEDIADYPEWLEGKDDTGYWANQVDVKVKCIGLASEEFTKPCIILKSFNAG